MSQAETIAYIAVDDIRPHCAGEPDITERVKKAMRQAHTFWLSTDDTLRFRSALAAAILESPNEEEKERIIQSARICGHNPLGALDDCDDEFEPLPLIGMWRETKEAA